MDQAALTLIRALDEFGNELKPYLEANQLESMYQEVVDLRRALLGLEMGALYWETPPEIVDSFINNESLPIEDAAVRVTALLHQRRLGLDKA